MIALLVALAPAAVPLEVTWDAPEDCPTAAEVESAVERTLGPAVDEERVSIRASGRIEPTPTGYRLQLELHDGEATSQRELEGATCRELTDAAALILAMAIDPRVVVPPPECEATEPSTNEREAEPVETEAAPPTPTVTVTRAPEPPPPRRRPVHFVARVMAGLGVGPLPGPSASLALALGIGGRLWRVEAVGHLWPAVEGDAPDDPSRAARASLWSVGVRGCVVPQYRRVLFPVCGGGDAGMMQAVATTGVAQQLPQSTEWAAIVLGGGAEWWPIRYVGLGARLDGHAAAYRPRFVTEPTGLVHKAAPVGLQLLGGLLVRAP